MTPPGRAYIIDRPPATVVTDPTDRLTVALDRHLGVRPEVVARACEDGIFSSRVQTRLTIKHARALAAHRDSSLSPAGSLLEVYEACRKPTLSGRVMEAQ